MNRSLPNAVTKYRYDRRKSLERQNSVKESLDALGIGLDDDDDSVMRCIKLNPPLLENSCRTICRETDNVQGQQSSIIANKDKKRKCPPRRVVVSVETVVDFSTQSAPTFQYNKKEDSNRDRSKKSPGQKRVSRKPKQKSKELEGESSTMNQATPTTKPSTQKEEASRKPKMNGSRSRQKRPPRKPKKKSQELIMMDEDASIISLATDTSESINDSSFPTTVKNNDDNNANNGTKLLGVKKRSSFLVPTISPQVPIGLNDSMRIDDSGRSSVVTFSDFSEMTIVADLSDDNDDLFYNDEELAEFRHEAFLQSCGLREEFMSM